MSDDKEDLELQALQRELDDAFATTRPRRGYEDELWLRMQARRPLWTRVRDMFGSLGSLFREAPAIPLGAVAVLLVVVIGASVLMNSGLRLGTSHNSYSQGASAPDMALSEFGKLPTPSLHPGLVDRAPSALAAGPEAPAVWSGANLYFGPAKLRWTGQLPLEPPSQALVYQYSEPGPSVFDPFVASLGATSKQAAAQPGFLGTYSGQGFTVSLRGTVPELPREPYFVLTSANGAGATGNDPQTIAMNFLSFYGLFPSWPVVGGGTQQSGQQARVLFTRSFQLTAGQLAGVVDWNGEHYGIEVDLIDSQVRTVSGPLPLSLVSTSYRLISNVDAVRMALASPPASSQAIQPVPTVDLNTVEEVYVLAVAHGQGFYEPAYLFSGTFQYNGQTYTKRVLVPLVDPSLRSP